jgi:hypothetical protein
VKVRDREVEGNKMGMKDKKERGGRGELRWNGTVDVCPGGD